MEHEGNKTVRNASSFGAIGAFIVSVLLGFLDIPKEFVYAGIGVGVVFCLISAYYWCLLLLSKINHLSSLSNKAAQVISILLCFVVCLFIVLGLVFIPASQTKLEILALTPQFVGGAFDMFESKILLTIKNNSASVANNVKVTLRDISLPDREKSYIGDANQKLIPLDDPDADKPISINPGETKYFIFTEFIQSNGQPLHLRIGSFFIHRDEQFNILITYSGDNSPEQSDTFFIEYSDTTYKFGIVGEQNYVERPVPVTRKTNEEDKPEEPYSLTAIKQDPVLFLRSPKYSIVNRMDLPFTVLAIPVLIKNESDNSISFDYFLMVDGYDKTIISVKNNSGLSGEVEKELRNVYGHEKNVTLLATPVIIEPKQTISGRIVFLLDYKTGMEVFPDHDDVRTKSSIHFVDIFTNKETSKPLRLN